MHLYNIVAYAVTVLLVLAALAGCATVKPGVQGLVVPDRVPDQVQPAMCPQGIMIVGFYDMNGNTDDGYELSVFTQEGRVLAIVEFAPGERGEITRAVVYGRPYSPSQLRAAYPHPCAFLERT